jgi:hypothetical protein
MRDPSTYKNFHVRKSKVLHLLYFLKKHNPYYANIIIKPPDTVDLPDNADILDQLPHISPCDEPSEALSLEDSAELAANAIGVTN